VSFRKNIYKSPGELRLMLAPGLATAASLAAVRGAIRAGVTTLELDAIAEDAMRALGAVPNFMKEPGYHHTICASVNEDVVHGIPGSRVLEPGDIVSIDSGAELGGWNGDAAITVVVPDPSRPEIVAERQRLSDVTEQSLWHGIAALAS
jgi:methionyl aminopeptidase